MPVSILPLLSKAYDRVIYKQVSNYFEHFFNEIVRHIDQALLGKGDQSLFFLGLVSIMVT